MQTHNQFTKQCQRVIQLAEQLYGVSLPDVDILYNLRGRSAGQAIVRNRILAPDYSMRFNAEAIANYHTEMLEEVIPHEVAHLVCFAKPSIGNNHNRGWANICKQLGGTGETYHSFELTPGRTVTKHKYIATCGTPVELGTVRHNKLQRGQVTRYVLGSTKGHILKDGLVGTTTPTPKATPKSTHTQERKKGKVTNSSIIRAMIEDYNGDLSTITTDEDFLQLVLARCGQTRQLARSYIKNNAAKVMEARYG